MDSKRKCNILILLDAAVVMSIKDCKIILLIKRILLNIHSGAVDVSSENIDTLRERLLTDLEHNHGLVHPYGVNLISCLKFLSFADECLEFNIAVSFSHVNDLIHTFSFGLAVREKVNVLCIDLLKLFQFSLRILFPYLIVFHDLNHSFSF